MNFTNNPRSQVTGVLSNFQYVDPQCIVIYAGKDGGSKVFFARCCSTNFPPKTRSTSAAHQPHPIDNRNFTIPWKSMIAFGRR